MDDHEEAAERLNIKKAKMQFQQEIEAYIEEEKVHDIFQDMMTAIIKERPKDPIKFLIDHLKKPEMKRIIVVTPPGMKGGTDDDNICLMLEQHLKELHGQDNTNVISVGDLLSKEITKRSPIGQKINEARKNYGYIPDEIVIDLVQRHIEESEKDRDESGQSNTGWILEGFPRTRLQALALQQKKIHPDKFFMLNYADNMSIENLKIKLMQGGTGVKYNNPVELSQIAKNAITEYHVNIQGVKEQFMGNIIEIDGNKSKKKIVEEMARLLLLKDSNAPRKPPKIIMMGPPGVDLREHASSLAQKYKLIYIDCDQLVKDSIRREGESAQDLRQILKSGDMIPDDHVIRCLRERLETPDCKTNGWILQGAPTTGDQIGMLKELNMQPSLVITLDMSDHLIYEKLEQRRFDPVTNRYHYILSENIRDEAILSRLEHKAEDQHPYIKKKLLEYRGFMQHVLSEYAASIVRVNAEQPAKEVHKNFIEAIEMSF